MDRAEWLEARKKGIGGSDIAAVVGLSRWKSPMDVYLDKIGAGSERESSEPMYWGSKIEGILAERFQEEHPELVLMRNTENLVNANHEHPFMVGSFDGLIYDSPDVDIQHEPKKGLFRFTPAGKLLAGWEAKTASAWKREEWEGDSPPLEYTYQCQWYMGVAGLPVWWLSVLIGGNDYREWRIERDDDIIDLLKARAIEFWSMVENQTPPPVDGSEASKRVLDSLYPAEDAVLEPAVELSGVIMDTAARIVELKAELKEKQGELRLCENIVKEALGDNAVGFVGGYEITWKPVHKDEYVVKAQDYRVLRVNAPKEGAE